jgi:hypothetical protein
MTRGAFGGPCKIPTQRNRGFFGVRYIPVHPAVVCPNAIWERDSSYIDSLGSRAAAAGWAARTAGVSFNLGGGTRTLVGGEVGGLGSQNSTTWSMRGRASVPF